MKALWLMTALAFGSPTLESVEATGSLRERLVADDASVVLLFSSEQEGEIGPCGCDAVERGGMQRIRGYGESMQRRGASVIRLHVGGWMDPRPAQQERNQAMVGELGDWDAILVGFRDPPGFEDLGSVAGETTLGLGRALEPLPLVSSSISGPWPSWRVIERDDLRIAVTGVSALRSKERWPNGLAGIEPVEALEQALAERPPADVHVVLAYETAGVTEQLASLEGVDVLVEAGGYSAKWSPERVGDAIWLRTARGGTRLSELRLWIADGALKRAVHREVSVDTTLPRRRAATSKSP